MSKPWRPDEEIVRARTGAGRRLRSYWRDEVRPHPLPPGAAAGLVLVAFACMGVAFGIYQAFGPREIVAPGAKAEWSAGDAGMR